MNLITIRSLIEMGISATQARLFADPLAAAAERFQINTGRRVAAFVAQCAHESRGFTTMEEDLYYSTPERIHVIFRGSVPSVDLARPLARRPQALANVVYANRNGNGDPASGDGWRYRGRGLLQITGRTNYSQAAADLQRPYIEQPELVATPADAALTAARYWAKNGCNALADRDDVAGITRRINGPAMAGLADRQRVTTVALDAMRRIEAAQA